MLQKFILQKLKLMNGLKKNFFKYVYKKSIKETFLRETLDA